jgi:hypothetical protein
VVSSFGAAEVMRQYDPVFNWRFDHLMLAAGVLELGIAFICIRYKNSWLPTFLIGWLATSLLGYRACLSVIKWHRPCTCLGNLTDVIHINPQTADAIMKFVLIYLIAGSYLLIFLHQKIRGFNDAVMTPDRLPHVSQ